MRGIVDVLDTNGRVIDFKTASKWPNGIAADHGLQLSTYAMITPGANGMCRLDTVTKTKIVQVIQQTYASAAPPVPGLNSGLANGGGLDAGHFAKHSTAPPCISAPQNPSAGEYVETRR